MDKFLLATTPNKKFSENNNLYKQLNLVESKSNEIKSKIFSFFMKYL